MVNEKGPLMQRFDVFTPITSKQQEIKRREHELQIRQWIIILVPKRLILNVFGNNLIRCNIPLFKKLHTTILISVYRS